MNDHAPGNHPVVFGGMAGMVTVARPRSRRSVTKGNPAMISTPPRPLRGLGKRRLCRWTGDISGVPGGKYCHQRL